MRQLLGRSRQKEQMIMPWPAKSSDISEILLPGRASKMAALTPIHPPALALLYSMEIDYNLEVFALTGKLRELDLTVVVYIRYAGMYDDES